MYIFAFRYSPAFRFASALGIEDCVVDRQVKPEIPGDFVDDFGRRARQAPRVGGDQGIFTDSIDEAGKPMRKAMYSRESLGHKKRPRGRIPAGDSQPLLD